MKKRLVLSVLILITIVFAFTSCDFSKLIPGGNAGGDGGQDQQREENFIFDSKSELYLIVDDYAKDSSKIYNILDVINGHKDPDAIAQVADDSTEQKKHEIVFGKTDRDITKSATRRLDRLITNLDTDVRYVIYSDGKNLAVVYDEDDEEIAFTLALDYILSMVNVDTLTAKAGVIKEEVVDVYEYYAEKDTIYRDQQWAALAAKVGGPTGTALVNAMQSLYSLYNSDNDIIVWLANLFEPSICVCNGLYGETECKGTKYCGTAGFYYSNSARDNIGFLPDVESTYQALGLLNSTGITINTGSSWYKMLDDEMNADILAFVRAIQREDGYFVHPQWPTPGTSRISRDLNWSTSLLRTFGAAPYYTTPTGVQGIGAPKTTALKGQLTDSSVIACSDIIQTSTQAYLPHLESIATFKVYLNELNVRTNSYSAGNTLTAQSNQIKARDKALGYNENNGLYKTMIDHLNECQNPANGTWDFKDTGDVYYQVNGFMKVSGIYGTTYPLQHVDAALETIINSITYDKALGAAVDIYNPWFALHNIFQNISATYGSEGIEKTAELRQRLYETAPSTLIATRDKISVFKKPDGSFSYNPTTSSTTSQGCVAAVSGSKEGDVNGSVLSCSGLLDYIYTAMGLSGATKVPLFGDAERLLFMNEVKAITPGNKPNTTTIVENLTFEDYEKGDVPSEEKFLDAKVYNQVTGSLEVVEREDGLGNALLMKSTPASSGDYAYIKNQSGNPAANTMIFEGDFRLDKSAAPNAVEIYVGHIYMLNLRVEKNMIHIYERSSPNDNSITNDLGVKIPLSQWFRLKVEYYYGDHDSVRIKVYFDDNPYDDEPIKLLAVSDNYYDKAGDKLGNPKGNPAKTFSETNIYIPAANTTTLLIDNLSSYKTMDSFTPATAADGDLVINVDATAPEKTYDFEDGIPEEFEVVGTAPTLTGAQGSKLLTMASPTDKSEFTVPVNNAYEGGKCFTVSFDITASGVTSGKNIMNIVESEVNGNVAGYALVAKSDASGTYLAVHAYNGAVGAEVTGTRIPVGTTTNVRIEYYRDYQISIVYIDGEFISATSTVYSGAEKRKATEATFSFVTGQNYTVRLDNLKVERGSKSYLDAVKPEHDSIINDFESDNSAIIMGADTSIASMKGSNMAKLDSTKGQTDIKIPLQSRSNMYNAVSASLDIYFGKADADGVTHRVSVTDKDGNIIFGIVLAVNGANVEVYEMSPDGGKRMLLDKFGIAAVGSVGFDYYTEEKSAHLYVGGSCITFTNSIPYPQNASNTPAYLTVSSADAASELYIDNVKAETLYLVIEEKSIANISNTENDGSLTFEQSNSSNLPSRLHQSLIGSKAEIRVETVFNEYRNEYSNAAVLYTEGGNGNDKMGYKPHEGDSFVGASCITFEADIKMNVTGGAEKFWFYLTRNAEGTSDIAYQVGFSTSGGNYYFIDRNASSNYTQKTFQSTVKANEWHRLKIEYFTGDKDTARIRLSLDDEVIYVSDNYFGRTYTDNSPVAKSDIKRAYFYSFVATDGYLYLDNMIMYASDATCTDSVSK